MAETTPREVHETVRKAWRELGYEETPPWGFGVAWYDLYDQEALDRFTLADDESTVLGVDGASLLVIEPTETENDDDGVGCTIRPVSLTTIDVSVEYQNRWHQTKAMTGPEFVARATIEAEKTYTVTCRDKLDWIQRLLDAKAKAG